MSDFLHERPDLEHLKNQAKKLLKSLRAAEPEAVSKADAVGLTPPFQLADAQFALARGYGFESWAKLKRYLEFDLPKVDAYFAAVRAGDRETVSKILSESPALVNARNGGDFGAPAINLAANRNDRKMLELLLDHGADIDARSNWWAGSFGALDFANEEISEFLLGQGGTLTPHAAARLGKIEALNRMIEADPSVVNLRGGDGQFPLHFAKNPEIVDLLLDSGADIEGRDLDHEGTALQFRILDGPVRKRLLERGARPDIFSAVVEDDAELVARLLEEDPAAAGRKTTEAGNPQIPKAPGEHIYLYVLGASLPHQVATNTGSKRAYQALWDRAEPAIRLAMACWAEDRDAATGLIKDHPGLVRQVAAEHARCLPDAAWNRKTEAVKLMLEQGWDVDTVGGEASTAVDRAAFHGFDDVIEAVLPYHPDLRRKNVYGGTPLGACLYGSLHSWRRDGDYARSVELLLGAGAPKPERAQGSPAVIEVLKRWGIAS